MADLVIYAGILALIILIAIGGFYLTGAKHPTPIASTSTTVPYTTAPYTTYVSNFTTNTTITTSISKSINYCKTIANSVQIYNGNFSSGTYDNWIISGLGFGNAPLNLNNANNNGSYYLNKWSNYNGEFAATTFQQHHILEAGNISTTFVVLEPYLNFQIYSPQNSNLYVELILPNGSIIRNYYNTLSGQGTSNPDTFAYASLNVSAFMCKSISFRVVSEVIGAVSSDQSQFIAFGDLYQSQNSDQTAGIQVN